MRRMLYRPNPWPSRLAFVVTPFPNKAINSVFDSGGAGLETVNSRKSSCFLLDKKIVLPFGEASIALSNKIPMASIHSVSGVTVYLKRTCKENSM